MSLNDFAHLHLHTQYSFLDGAIRVTDLIKHVAELGMKQVAVTDHGNMFGALDFYTQAKRGGIKPIMGIEAYITGKAKHTEKIRENYHLVLLAENNIGYENLRKLTSKAFIDGKYYYPRIDKELLYEHREGLIASTACLGGEVGKKCAKGDLDGAREAIRDFKKIFGPNNFFLEVQPNGIVVQERVNALLAQLAKDEGLRINATNDCHYVTKDQHEAQNILMAIRQQKAFDDPTLHKHETDAFYIRSPQEMWDLLRNDYAEGFESACEIGRRCNVTLDVGSTYLPAFPKPDRFKDELDYLYHLSIAGLERRFTEMPYSVDQEQYKIRLQTELKVITSMGFSGYFLIVQDFINWAKNNRIRVGPGRGSGAGSLVAYALRITDLDPIPYNLLFERFLNPERVSMPDFDVDFMQERRGEVIQYVADRYGRDHVGQIATYSALNPKSAIKDVARTLGIQFAEINELTKPMPLLVDGKKPSLDEALTYAPKLKQKALEDKNYAKVINIARTLEGLFRQAGTHAGGVVIGDKPLIDYVPVFSGSNGELITQFDKDKVELAGLVKFDFLGLKTLDVISHAEELVNARIGRENLLNEDDRDELKNLHPHSVHIDGEITPLDVALLAPTNEEVYKLISSGDTLGVFQVESSGFQDLCRKLKPDCFEDIVAAVALYRPGPMQSGMVEDFIDRKHGRKQVIYPHPLLEEVLKPTYGTFVYQEQVMQSAQVLAGYSLGGADILRRAMGKKKLEEMQQQRAQFIEGTKANNVDPDQAGNVFDTIEKFAGYGFNKSHSAAYAMITYQTGYLKRFYPIEFLAALLSTSSGNTDDIVKYINEARSHGIEVAPPDINVSERSFTVEYTAHNKSTQTYGRIRFGLDAIKGLGDAAAESLIAARNTQKIFKSLYHFCETVPAQGINKRVVEALVKCGAFDSFNRTRRQLFETIEKSLAHAQQLKKDISSGQANMFDLFAQATKQEPSESYEDFPEWPEKEKLRLERETIGFYISGHPLDRYAEDARKMGAIPTVKLAQARPMESVQIVGMVVDMRERPLKSGNGRWAVVVAEDNHGQAELLCFNKSYQEAEGLLKSGEPLLFFGKVMHDDSDDENKGQSMPRMRLEKVISLSQAQIERTTLLRINIALKNDQTNSAEILERLVQLFAQYQGEKPVELILQFAYCQVALKCGEKFYINPTDDFIAEAETISSTISAARI